MRWVLAVVLAGLFVHSASAQAAPEQSPTASAAPQSSIISYPASFFAPMGLDTAYDMVRRIPGFTFDDGGSARGFASAVGNVLIDGQRPASKTDDLVAILTRLPAAQVERIDLIRGGAPGIDMQGKPVVANVIRRKAEGFTGIAGVGQYTTGDGYTDPQTQLEGTWRRNGRTVEASFHSFEGHDDSWGSGPHEIRAPDGALLDFSRMRNTAPNEGYKAAAAYETPLLGGKIRANLTLEDQPSQIRSADFFMFVGPQSEHQKQDAKDGELGLHYTRRLAANLGLELLALQHLADSSVDSVFKTVDDDQHFHLDNNGGESIMRGIAHWRASDALNVDAGGEFAYNWLDAATSFEDNGVAIALPAANVRVHEARGEVFAAATWRASRALAIEAGVRVEDSTIASSGDVALSKTLLFAKPRLLLTWSATTADQIQMRIEREVGQLDFGAFTANAALNGSGVTAGNPDLSPQQNWLFEGAIEHRFWGDGVLSVKYRHLEITDAIDRAPIVTPSGVFDEPANIGDGVEDDIIGSFNLPLAKLGLSGALLRGAATWRASQITDPTTHDRRRISAQIPLETELHFNQDMPHWHLNWGVNFILGNRQRTFLFDEIDASKTSYDINAFGEYKIRTDLAFRIQLYNRSNYKVERDVFSGPRNLDPLQFVDFQQRRFGPVLFMRLRKTFG